MKLSDNMYSQAPPAWEHRELFPNNKALFQATPFPKIVKNSIFIENLFALQIFKNFSVFSNNLYFSPKPAKKLSKGF